LNKDEFRGVAAVRRQAFTPSEGEDFQENPKGDELDFTGFCSML